MPIYTRLKKLLFTDDYEEKNIGDVFAAVLFLFLVGTTIGGFFLVCFWKIIQFYMFQKIEKEGVRNEKSPWIKILED